MDEDFLGDEEWSPEDAHLVWKLDPATGNHIPTLEFPYRLRMHGELEVTIREAKDVAFTRIGGGTRAFVELKLGQKKVATDPQKFENKRATIERTLECLEINSQTEVLRVSLFNHSKTFKQIKMGTAYLPLSELNTCMVTIKDKDENIVPADTKSAADAKGRRLEPSETTPIPYFIEYPFVADLRSKPTTDPADVNGRSIAAGTLFYVVERIEKEDEGTEVNGGKNTFLRLADNAGWIFTTHQKDGRVIARPSMEPREETELEKKYDLIKQHQAWVELCNPSKKPVGRVLLFLKMYISSEKEWVPEGEYKTGKKRKKKNKKKDKVFGGTLAQSVDSSSGEEIPQCCKELIDFLKKNGLETEGLFRVPGHHSEMQKIQDLYERKEKVVLKEVHDAAGVLKKFFRELKEPIIPKSHNASVLEIAESKDRPKAKIEKFKFVLSTLPAVNKATMGHLLGFLSEVSQHAEKNKMGVKNLGVVWAPNLFDPSCMSFAQMIHAVEILIDNHSEIFGVGGKDPAASQFMQSLKVKKKGKHKRSQSSRSFKLYGGNIFSKTSASGLNSAAGDLALSGTSQNTSRSESRRSPPKSIATSETNAKPMGIKLNGVFIPDNSLQSERKHRKNISVSIGKDDAAPID
mmetsp:Transcript_12315/g.25057  ORF Transcript_12315/g.25057 Transcript_12315/m.25057 type:complete len:633 (-) Transcript_12315:1529-3427(-)